MGCAEAKWLASNGTPLTFGKKTIQIKHTVTQMTLDGKTITVQKDRAKTKSGCRTLPLVPPFEELLHRLQKEQQRNQMLCGERYSKQYLEYIYVDAMGELVKSNYLTQHFDLILKTHKLKKIRCHDHRHAFATIALENSMDIKTVSGMLGHYSAGFTLDTYAHVDYRRPTTSAGKMAECPVRYVLMVSGPSGSGKPRSEALSVPLVP